MPLNLKNPEAVLRGGKIFSEDKKTILTTRCKNTLGEDLVNKLILNIKYDVLY